MCQLMRTLNSYLRVFSVKCLILTVLSAMGSGYAYSQTITANTISVCEGDPVQLEVAGLSVPSGGNIQWFVNGKKYKVTKGSLCTVEVRS